MNTTIDVNTLFGTKQPIHPITSSDVNISGNRKIPEKDIQKHFQDLEKVNNLKDLHSELIRIKGNLTSTNLFDTVRISIKDENKDNSKLKCSVNVEVREFTSPRSNITLNVTEKGVNLSSSTTTRNLFGKNELSAVDISVGDQFLEGDVSLSKAFFPWGNPTFFKSRAFRSTSDFTKISNYKQTDFGSTLSYTINNHQFAHVLNWRNIEMGPNPSKLLATQSGVDVRSSLVHVYKKWNCDHPIFPTQGYGYSFRNELAGIGGDSKFLKHNSSVLYNIPFPRFSLNLLSQVGLIIPLEKSEVKISDRYFTTIRGFADRGIGPHSEKSNTGKVEAYGGDMYLVTSAFLTFPIPKQITESNSIRGHIFLTAGNLTRWGGGINSVTQQNFHNNLSSDIRMSVGAGLVASIQGMRFEVNASIPVWHCEGDQKSGFQIGITTDILEVFRPNVVNMGEK